VLAQRRSTQQLQEPAMGNLGFGEMLLIGVALLIFFGPSKLPELGKALGKGIQEFKKASKELTDAVKEDVTVDKGKETDKK
jgi:TatA/E family protein of Tat protein translocase